MRKRVATVHHGDKGSAARFFYCAKVKPKERDEGLERFIATSASDMTGGRKEGSVGINDPRAGAGRTNGAKNNHPTVKPIALMSYLCRLITPPVEPCLIRGWEAGVLAGLPLRRVLTSSEST